MACRLNRLIKLIRMVNGRSFPNVQYLCESFQIKERTFFNDLKELKEELGVDIQFDRSKRGYYLASDIAEISLITVNEESALLLLGAVGLLGCFGGEQLALPLQKSFGEDIQISLGSGAKLPEIFQVEHIERIVDKNLFLDLCRACLKAESVKVTISAELRYRIEQEGQRGAFDAARRVDGGMEIWPRFLVLNSSDWKVAFGVSKDDGNVSQIPLSQLSRSEDAPKV